MKAQVRDSQDTHAARILIEITKNTLGDLKAALKYLGTRKQPVLDENVNTFAK